MSFLCIFSELSIILALTCGPLQVCSVWYHNPIYHCPTRPI